ncbi:hypothetical protein M9H77_13945 [Catharanthus roseus]|uniref:Uncharacterized protein n=1 Tax=Catharanthus roseus TaxID=4058 RepID=A0ACC0BLR3_CATRO|nr:hypothetical protein M9H77_13945 [Catharanthus roseus]
MIAAKVFSLLFKVNLYGNHHLQFTDFVYTIFDLMWQAGTESKQWKFDHVMKEIQERNVDAYIYLMKLDPEKWTLLHDGGHRHGIMTINISNALNSVLKKARVLPLKALFELIFNKLVKYFHQHRKEAENYVHPFPTQIFDKFLRIEMKSREHKVILKIREKEYTWSNLRSEENGSRADTYVPKYIHDKRTEELTKRIFIQS